MSAGLSRAKPGSIVMHLSTSPDIDRSLLAQARELTGLRSKTALLNAGLEALIARESGRQLIALAGAEPKLRVASRRRAPIDRSAG